VTLLCALAWLGACAHEAQSPPKPADPAPAASVPDLATAAAKDIASRRVYTSKLEDVAQFEAFSKDLAGERFTKFIVDRRTDDVYYFDVNVWPLHVDFVFDELYDKELTDDALDEFNKNYEADKPEFLLGSIVRHRGGEIWSFAFWSGDLIRADHVQRAKSRLKATLFAGDQIRFRPDSNHHEAVAKELTGIPVITNDELYRTADYQAFNKGARVGRLRIVRDLADVAAKPFSPDEIVVLAANLPDVSPVRGIVTEQFSSPLSHVALRAKAWGIPHAGLKGASKRFAELDGKAVYFSTAPGTWELRAATPAEIDAEAAAQREAKTVRLPPVDLETVELRPLARIRMKHVAAYGAKAANLGEIAGGFMPGFFVPDGFGIPTRHYAEHLKRHGLDKRIEALLADEKFANDAAVRRNALADLRKAIAEAPVDPGLKELIKQSLAALEGGPDQGTFVRSSTNAEDLSGFNGAGLYDTVPNARGLDAVCKAVGHVWASVWNLRAFEERAFFGIDHGKVYGAVLVQVGVDATAAGVLVTANLFDPTDEDSYTINAKSGLGMGVVEGRRVPEQILFDTSNLGVKVISRSDERTMLVFDAAGGIKEIDNPGYGKAVLTDERALELARAAWRIADHLKWEEPLDIEWLFEGEQLHIVQARPYVRQR